MIGIARLLKEIMNVLKMMLMISLHVQLVVPRRRPQENEDEDSGESFENLLYFQDCSKKKEAPATKSMPYSGPQIIVKEVAPQCQQCPAVCYSCCFNPPPPPAQNGVMSHASRSNSLSSPLNMGQNHMQMPGAIPGGMSGSMSGGMTSAMSGGMPGSMFGGMSGADAGAAPVPIPGAVSRTLNNLESPLANNQWSQIRNTEVNSLLNGPIQKKKKIKPISLLNSIRRSGGNLKGLIEKDDDIKKILRDLVKVTIQKVDTIEKGRNNENYEEFPSSEVIVVQDRQEAEGNVNVGTNNGDENEE